MFVVKLPLSITLGVNKKRTYIINMNNFRNWKHFLKNTIKQEFHKEVVPQLPPVKLNGKVKITYTYYDNNNRRKDLSNVCAMIDKFFSDCLVEAGVIQDDCIDILPAISYRYGGKDEFKEGYVLAIVEEM